MKTTPDLKTVALQKALAQLNAIGAMYKIIMPDGAEYGTLVAVPPKPEKERKRRPNMYPKGEMIAYWMPFMENAKPGDVVLIPKDKFDLESLRGGITSWCTRNWGSDSVITAKRDDQVEILVVYRQAMPEVQTPATNGVMPIQDDLLRNLRFGEVPNG